MRNISKKRKGFLIGEVSKITEVSIRQIRYWEKEGMIEPAASRNRERGEIRVYTLQDIVCILVIKDLRKTGLSIQVIKESVRRVGKVSGITKPLAKLRVACLANTVYFKTSNNFIDPISGQMAINQALEEIRPKLERRRFVPGKRAVENASRQHKIDIALKISGL